MARLDTEIFGLGTLPPFRDPRLIALRAVLKRAIEAESDPHTRKEPDHPPAQAQERGARNGADTLSAKLVAALSFPLGIVVFGIFGPLPAAVLMAGATILYVWASRNRS